MLDARYDPRDGQATCKTGLTPWSTAIPLLQPEATNRSEYHHVSQRVNCLRRNDKDGRGMPQLTALRRRFHEDMKD